jgi:hypothetical protein
MGFGGAARRLRKDEDGDPEYIRLMIARIEGRAFALVIGVALFDQEQAIGIGIEVKALRAVSAAIGGSDEELMAYRSDTERLVSEIEGHPYSIFPDGTFLGIVNFRDIERIETFYI